MLETYERHAKLKLITTVVTILVIAGVVVFADHLKAQSSVGITASLTNQSATSTTPSTTSASSTSTASTNATTTNSSGYKDGTYTATSDYFVPPGQESIKVNLTLSSGTITSVSIQNSEGDRDSALFQENFASQYKQYVVGKKISSLRLGVIAGASDTTQGFADALSQIAAKAQS